MQRILLFLLLSFSISAQSALFDKKTDYLKVDDAFQLSITQSAAKDKLQLNWQVAEGYYLYQDKITVRLNATNETLPPTFSRAAEKHEDPYFGQTLVFDAPFQAQVAFPAPLQDNAEIEISYQGCTEGFCYPPETKVFKDTNIPVSDKLMQTNESATQPEQNRLAENLTQSKWAVLGFFLLGLGLAFTPCVLPMLPLLSAIVIGQQNRPSAWRALILSVLYVQGMALTYTVLGLIVAAIGLPFQVALQHPYVLIGLSILFTLLALSMFGLYSLQLPSSLQTKLSLWSQQQKAGAFGGVFVMGMIAGLVASPCTSAPLSGALLYVAQSGDLWIGGLSLYLLALGMGVPLILITLFGNKILPKSGAWMDIVKTTFGFVMLALPVFLISRILPDMWAPRLWALLGTAFFIWLALQLPRQGVGLLMRIFLFIAAMVAVQPLQAWLWGNSETQQQVHQSANFTRVTNQADIDTALATNSKPVVMLDLYADWCVACKEFEHETFSNEQVQRAFENVRLLQVDMTQNSPENQAIMAKYQVLGLPTILFFDAQGKEIPQSRITGFMDATQFSNWLAKLQSNP